MNKMCRFQADPENPRIKVCTDCGFRMESKQPPERCRAMCGRLPAGTATNPISVSFDVEPPMVLPHIALGDLAELVLKVLTFGMDGKVRRQRWVRLRNAIFDNRFVQDYLGLRLRLGKTCDCEARRQRWNSAGVLVAPVWLQWWLKPYRMKPAKQLDGPTGCRGCAKNSSDSSESQPATVVPQEKA